MKKHQISIALQGGGSHGAFTWGVLDRLLEEKHLEIIGISGTSAGAINGALVATGLVKGNAKTARQNLDEFWKGLSESYSSNAFSKGSEFLQYFKFFEDFWVNRLLNLFSPYDFATDASYLPLQKLMDAHVDFECLRDTNKIQIYVSATNVETNRIKVFNNKDICSASLLASSCLPTIRQAVEWQGSFYWDGGFMGNPILEPLVYNCAAKDLVIVQVNPINKPGVPKTPRQILDRLNEVTFNASLMREIRTIINIQKMSESALCSPLNPYASLRLHVVKDEPFMAALGANTKFNTDWDFLTSLKEKGREAAAQWLKTGAGRLGQESSMDLSQWHMETPTTTCIQWPYEPPSGAKIE